MKKFFVIAVSIVVTFAWVSCSKNTGHTLTSATGSIYECLVVMNSQALTQDELNAIAAKSIVNEASGYAEPVTTTYDMVKAIMGADMPCMPQMESYFRVMQVNPVQFDDMFKPTRNILIVDIDPQRYTQLKVKVSTDHWSTPQAICRIQAPSQEEFVTYWLENGEGIREWFVNQEITRQIRHQQRRTHYPTISRI